MCDLIEYHIFCVLSKRLRILRHVNNGAVIARSSQPEVGWLGWRSSEDEDLLKALADACSYDKGESTMVDSPITYSDVGDDTITQSAAKVRILKYSPVECIARIENLTNRGHSAVFGKNFVSMERNSCKRISSSPVTRLLDERNNENRFVIDYPRD